MWVKVCFQHVNPILLAVFKQNIFAVVSSVLLFLYISCLTYRLHSCVLFVCILFVLCFVCLCFVFAPIGIDFHLLLGCETGNAVSSGEEKDYIKAELIVGGSSSVAVHYTCDQHMLCIVDCAHVYLVHYKIAELNWSPTISFEFHRILQQIF